jgi:Cu+-exporting ATPase
LPQQLPPESAPEPVPNLIEDIDFSLNNTVNDINVQKIESAGLISKSDLYSDAGRRHAPKRYEEKPQQRGNIADLNLKGNLGSKLMPDTGTLDDAETAKIRELERRRQDKVKSFRLVGEEEDVPDKAQGDENARDFDSFDATRRVGAGLLRNQRNYVLSALALLICTLLGLSLAVINDLLGIDAPAFINKIPNTAAFLILNAVIGVVAGIASFGTINGGITKLLSGKPDADTLAALLLAGSVLLTCMAFADTAPVKQGYVQILVPVAAAALFFNTLGKILLMNRARKNFRIFSGARHKYAVMHVPDDETASLTRGTLSPLPVPNLSAYAETEFATDFIKKTYEPDITDRFAKRTVPAVMIAATVVGIVAGFFARAELGSAAVFAGISVFLSVIAAATGFINLLIVNAPAASEAHKLNALGSVMLGFAGAEEFADTNAILLDAKTLFPRGCIALLGVKLYSDTRLDEAIVEAASLTHQAGSIIDSMFYDIIHTKTELLSPVESYIYEDSMGLAGWINNRRVLFGNRDLMINHSINGLPSEAKEAEYTGKTKSAVYLSISGELSAMFVIDLIPNVEIADALLEFQKKNINIILRTVDSALSIAKLSDLFDISPEYIKLLPFRLHEQFDSVTAYRPRISANAVCSGELDGISAIFTSAKKLRATAMTGLSLQTAATVIGVILLLAMVIFGSAREINVTFLTAYNTAFLLILSLVHAVGRLF